MGLSAGEIIHPFRFRHWINWIMGYENINRHFKTRTHAHNYGNEMTRTFRYRNQLVCKVTSNHSHSVRWFCERIFKKKNSVNGNGYCQHTTKKKTNHIKYAIKSLNHIKIHHLPTLSTENNHKRTEMEILLFFFYVSR